MEQLLDMQVGANPKLLLALMQPTPMHDAVREGDSARLKALLRSRRTAGEVLRQDMFGYTPLILAAECRLGKGAASDEMVALLLDYGAASVVNVPCKVHDQTALHVAAFHGNVGAVQKLIRSGAHVNALTDDHRTPLFQAAFGGHAAVVKELLAAGADPSVRDADKQTPLDVTKDVECQGLLA
ncbi:Ankyrin repeat domain-containing protein 10 [Porphyridium purpureum]|uniref:Ankyrin repeat domain-containing protein 10 n=1 Tax=Porphyridium purpureum TaxID=35688 RepID=A0A5J4YMZ8_PORPP|nr:Ankyrin repeat domain-containing protein 10 [Porphyridium purpureum]|eukprot:POR4003..scf295_9